MSYLLYIAIFGSSVCLFLWLRDLRIYLRTALPGYRTSAYQGIVFSALTTLGTGIIWLWPAMDVLGTGLVMLGLFLQGRIQKEKIWTDEPVLTRMLGKAPIQK